MLGTKIREKFGWTPRMPDDTAQAVVDPDAYALYERGLELAAQCLHTQAMEMFIQAIRINWHLAEAHHELGKTYIHLGRVDKAIKAFRAAVQISPDRVKAYNDLGMAYDCAGNFLEAIKVHMKALRLEPDSIEVRNNLGMTYYNMGSYTDAIKAFNQALQIEDDSVQAHYGLALVYIDLRRKDSAMEEHEALKNLGQAEVAANLLDEIHKQF
jgi:Flp pilus assembly protein TadD